MHSLLSGLCFTDAACIPASNVTALVLLSCAVAIATIGLGAVLLRHEAMAPVRRLAHLARSPVRCLSLAAGTAAGVAAPFRNRASGPARERALPALALPALALAAGICATQSTGLASTVSQCAMAVALLAYALVFAAAGRRFAAAQEREAEALRRANDELRRGREQFDTALSNLSQGVTFFDSEERLIVSNARYGEIYGLSDEDRRTGRTLKEIANVRFAAGTFPVMPKDAYMSRRRLHTITGLPFEVVDQLANGRIVAMHCKPMADGGWVATHEDITERARTEANVVYLSRHDLLTGLPNRLLFQERLEQAIALTGRGDQCAVVCLDLDHFKLINDTFGHAAGDVLLQATAERLKACVREVDTVARLGGDEFGIVQLGVKEPRDVELLTQRIIRLFREPFQVDGQQVLIRMSVGAALAPGDGSASAKLLKNADLALGLAKAERRGSVCFFEPAMDERISKRRALELDLRGALLRDEFEMYYQPLIELATGRITEFEALLRWHHPERGLVPPSEFIPIAEETGLIVGIGEWVLRTACREAQAWPAAIRLAINLSPVQFTRSNIFDTVKAALDCASLRPHRLEVEITESVLLQESESILASLHQLRAMGVSVSLDDFGTGYSSLSYLHRFPFDKIKIDQSFVRDMGTNKHSMSIVRAIAGLGESLRMTTTAEGVETVEQLEMLRGEGCTQAQGYLVSRPVPASRVPWLLGHRNPCQEAAVA